VANALKVTFLGNSELLFDPLVCCVCCLMTGFNGGLGLAVINPADVAKSRNFWDNPVLLGLFGGAITCGSVVGVMYL
jgi:hypothetical protein